MNNKTKDRYLITGGYGFIGSSLIRNLLRDGEYVANIDKLSYSANLNSLEGIETEENYIFFQNDICDELSLFNIISNFKPTKVIHLAAETHVDRSIDNPSNFIQSNIIGTYNLLNSCLRFWNSLETNERNNFRLLLVSTDEVYGSLSLNDKVFTEDSNYKPNSPYSASKAASDLLGRAWIKTFELPVIVTNTSNNYGPWQYPEKLIPLTISKCLKNKKIPIYGNGEQIRDWIYVDDHSEGILSAINNGKVGEKYNISSKNELKNIDVVNDICSILDDLHPMGNENYNTLIDFVTDRPGHDFRYALSNSKIKALGWKPKTSWLKGLEQSIKWYLNNRDFLENYSGERLGRSN